MKVKPNPPPPNASGASMAARRPEELGRRPRRALGLTPVQTPRATRAPTPAAAQAPGNFVSRYFYTLSAMTVLVAVFAMVYNSGSIPPASQLPSYDAVREQLDVVVAQCQKFKEMPPPCRNILLQHQMTRSHTNSLVVTELTDLRLRDSGSSFASAANALLPTNLQQLIPQLLMLSASLLLGLYVWQIQALRQG